MRVCVRVTRTDLLRLQMLELALYIVSVAHVNSLTKVLGRRSYGYFAELEPVCCEGFEFLLTIAGVSHYLGLLLLLLRSEVVRDETLLHVNVGHKRGKCVRPRRSGCGETSEKRLRLGELLWCLMGNLLVRPGGLLHLCLLEGSDETEAAIQRLASERLCRKRRLLSRRLDLA